MAKVLDTNVQSQTVSSYFPVLQITIIGMVLGLLFWFFNLIIGRYTNSISVSGDISTILVATVGLVLMVTMRMPRPIIIVLFGSITLWGLAVLTSGLSLVETISWEVALYALVYLLISWLARYSKVLPVLAAAALIVVLARITISL